MSKLSELSRRQLLKQFVAMSEGETSSIVPGTPMSDMIHTLINRRTMLKGSAAMGAAGFVAAGLVGCGGASETPPVAPIPDDATPASALNFSAIGTSDLDAVVVPEGHSARVLYAYGDPMTNALAEFRNDGTEPALEFDNRAGDHHDGMYFFGLDADGNIDENASDRGILCINHENITQGLMHVGEPSTDDAGNRTDIDEVRKEQRAHGISCIEIVRDTDGNFDVVRDSPFNRRITTLTPTVITGPAAGSPLLRTRFSPEGIAGRGTINNCANGFTPWGTYLTCEENYDLYFRDERGILAEDQDPLELHNPSNLGFANFLAGIGDRVPTGLYGWATLAGVEGEINDEFGRWNVTPQAGAAADGTEDFRNEGNQYGYIVEIDPLDPTAAPRKRTALGRFAHEGVWPANQTVGQPVVFYMGDDDQLQFIYKFVSAAVFEEPPQGESPLDTGERYMNDGTLYVSRYDDNRDGTLTGEWIPLTLDNPILAAASAPGAQFEGLFDSLDSIIVHARAAAFAVGATPMDRPEWGAVNPFNNEVYFTLTNNSDRQDFMENDPAAVEAAINAPLSESSRDEVTEFLAQREFGTDAANPRGPNSDGHILRLREDGDTPTATSFVWDIFVFGAGFEDDAAINMSGLSANNEFTDCDGLWFDNVGVLWIQTDGRQPNGNNQMLAALPGEVGDGGISSENGEARLRRFLVGPGDCEITGIDMTPDRRSLFFNVQHPGDRGNGNWPTGRDATIPGVAGTRARSATVVVTRDDGMPLGSD